MKLFISYRREDTAGRAGRLFDVLAARFGTRNVFQDVTAVAPGAEFAEQVEAAIAQSDAVLVIIGSDWLTISRPDGTRRLDDADDFVRREVSAALTSGSPVVPVLVDGATLPSAEELPPELRALIQRHAVEVRDSSFHQDVENLARRLQGDQLEIGPRRRWPKLAGAIVVLGLVLGGIAWSLRDRPGDDDDR